MARVTIVLETGVELSVAAVEAMLLHLLEGAHEQGALPRSVLAVLPGSEDGRSTLVHADADEAFRSTEV